MSDIKQHVTSLEMSKRLAEAGVNKKGIFYWYQDWSSERWKIGGMQTAINSVVMNRVEAYTASKLGQMLPDFIEEETDTGRVHRSYLTTGYMPNGRAHWGAWYDNRDELVVLAQAPIEADARAALLLKLIDAGHVDPSTLNAETE